MSVEPGVYQHYKGKFYRVLMLGVIDGSREPAVIYVPLWGDGEPTVRTVKDFTEELKTGDYIGPRFRKYIQ